MRRRWWLTLTLLGLLVVAVVPGTWWVTRPATSAGAPVDAPVMAGPATGQAPTHSSVTGAVPTTRAILRPGSRATPTAVTAGAGQARLTVASLGIDAPIVGVGVQKDGSMAIPAQILDVGWYQFGPAPGSATGSAVLAGHVDSAAQGKGALFTLNRIGVGARVAVTLSSGRTVSYRVTGRELFVKRRLPVERLFTRDGAPRLVIITCGGPFNQRLGSYRDNLVVAAEPEPSG